MASAARNVAARSLHIKIHPTPRSFPEQREVLRVLENFGEVEMFRSLKYDLTCPIPNAFITILESEEAAHAALEASPIRYRLIADPASSPPPSSSTSAPKTSSSSFSPTDHTPTSTSTTTTAPPEEAHFTLSISPTIYPHSQIISSSPLHASWIPVTARRSPIASDLAQRIAPCIAKAGLVDWVTGSPAYYSGGWGAAGTWGEEGAVKEATKPWRVRERERKEREQGVPGVMKGLRAARERAREAEKERNAEP